MNLEHITYKPKSVHCACGASGSSRNERDFVSAHMLHGRYIEQKQFSNNN